MKQRARPPDYSRFIGDIVMGAEQVERARHQVHYA
jgi:hypothetical protein